MSVRAKISNYPFPTRRRGAQVAVSMCSPSGHHWKNVVSVAYINIM